MPTHDTGPFNLASTFLRLRSDVSIEPLAAGDDFWPKLIGGALGTFHNEYLVVSSAFNADWPTWEMHPNGDEIVCLLDGKATLVLEIDGREHAHALSALGDYVRVPRGTWHTAKTSNQCRMLFITAGEDTQIRPA
jgi:quercetin dioxygenase-like cupin family protein